MAVFAFALAATSAMARERELWDVSHDHFIFTKESQADTWLGAARRMDAACDRSTSVRKAFSRLRVPNRYVSHLQRLIRAWPTIYRLAGYDDACAQAWDYRRLAIEIGQINQFCPTVIPCRKPLDEFTVYDRGVQVVRFAAPDVCRWEIGLVSFAPTAVVKTPC